MVLNAEPMPLSNVQQVYQATPSDAADPSKLCSTPVLDLPGTGEDDPAISADGLLVVFSEPVDGTIASQPYASFAAAPGATFGAPRLVEGLDPTMIHSAPEISPVPPPNSASPYELFFSGTSGERQIYRAVCDVQ